ncbi:MAG TPA: hypothetical protein VLT36_04400 [Candidatus Dormibacteraeota bacterium]|nr:hypothetical protein [Candidatus Dormibacteraeota bacterium]
MKCISKLLVCASVAAVLVASVPARAQSTNKAPAEKKSSATAEPSTKKSRSIPFEGNVTGVDKSAKTLKVDKRTFQITSETKIYKGDKAALLESGTEGEYVTGSYKKTEDGKLIANSVYFGGKSKGKSAEKKKKE